jgi:superfamily II DNA/RNA helicase
MSFESLGLSPTVLQAVTDAGYTDPTPIQTQAIPWVLMGRDVLGCAQTGTGKTAGFTLPMIDILASGRAKARMPRSLILEPTRELAAQVAENFDIYGKHNKLSMALLIGGVSFDDQERILERGVDVLVATPGRLLDHFERGKVLLNDVKLLVIDEADRMLDMGFIPDVERIVSLIPKIRQTLFFSATMAPEIRRLADAFLMNPKEITVSRPATAATTVTQGLAVVDEMDKREALRRLIRKEDVKNAIVFCNRKRDVDILFKSLKKHGFNVGALHGDLSQPVRTDTLEKFRNGEIQLLIASDVAARGLDIDDMSHVFNFDVPIHAEDYVHRIGRTGRAGKTGIAYTLATPDDGEFVAAIEKLAGHAMPRIEIPDMAQVELAEGGGKRRRGRGRPTGRGDDRQARDRRPRREAPRREQEKPVEAAETVAAPVPATEAPAEAAVPAEAAPERSHGERRERSRRGERGRGERHDEQRTRGGRPDEPRDEDRRRGGRHEERHARQDERLGHEERQGRHEERHDHGRHDGRREGRHEDRRHEDRRQRHRDRDLGPPVLGMGDHTPAFLLQKVPAHLARGERPRASDDERNPPSP